MVKLHKTLAEKNCNNNRKFFHGNILYIEFSYTEFSNTKFSDKSIQDIIYFRIEGLSKSRYQRGLFSKQTIVPIHHNFFQLKNKLQSLPPQ